jgi:hypothetical protein
MNGRNFQNNDVHAFAWSIRQPGEMRNKNAQPAEQAATASSTRYGLVTPLT